MVSNATLLLKHGFNLHALYALLAAAILAAVHDALERTVVGTQVEVVDEGILLVTYVYECCVQAGHNLAYATKVDVAYRESRLTLLFVKLDEHLVFT